MFGSKETVLITGASGFLGQHLVKELQCFTLDKIKEIRLVDRLPFRKFLDFPNRIPMKYHEIDCANHSRLKPILAGCSTVFHLAGKRFQLTLHPDIDQYWHDNLTATEVLVEEMINESVCRLIFVSDSFANLQPKDNFGFCEVVLRDCPNNGKYLMEDYGESKFRAELVVRNATGRPLKNYQKGCLKTLILRPTLLYGEGENNLIPMVLNLCRLFGRLPKIGERAGSFQMMYAGNLAALLVKCHQFLGTNDKVDEYNGEICYCTDNEHCIRIFEYLSPFVENAGYHLSSYSLNYYVGSLCGILSEYSCNLLYWLFHLKVGTSLPSFLTVRLSSAWIIGFATIKMRLLFDFVPPYNPQLAMQNSINWWKDKLDNCQRNDKK